MVCLSAKKLGKPTEEALIFTNEIIELGEKILAECTDDKFRLLALNNLCSAYAGPEIGMTGKAIEFAEKLPSVQYAREDKLAELYEGEKKNKQYRDNISLYFGHLIQSMMFYNETKNNIIITKKIFNLIEIMIEDENLHNKTAIYEKICLRNHDIIKLPVGRL